MEHFDCVVIGGGMVGAASALTLAQLGLRVAVVEKYQQKAFSPTQSVDLRVSAISLASENLLTQLGAWSQIAQWRLCPYKRLAVWECENAYTEFNALNIEQTHLGHIVENRLIQLALWQQMTSNHNIQLYCPESLTSLTQQSDKATLVLEQSTITANLVIGADGAQSKVRQMSGIGLTGWDYQQSAMLINVETQHPQQDITWQQYLPAGPIAFLPLSTPTTCDDKGEVNNQQMSGQASLVWYHNRDEIKRLSALSNKQLTQEILNTFPERLGNVNVIDKGAFALTRRHANTYQNKQVLLLGDAAHTINPMAGQGVNLGFKDVKALHEVIASAIAHNECWYAPEVLARYETLRRNDNLLMMSTMDALYTGFKHPSPLIKAARNLALLAINKVPVINSTVKNKALAYACGI